MLQLLKLDGVQCAILALVIYIESCGFKEMTNNGTLEMLSASQGRKCLSKGIMAKTKFVMGDSTAFNLNVIEGVSRKVALNSTTIFVM